MKNIITIDPDLVTLNVKQVAKVLNISSNTAYELVKQPGFPSFRLGKRILTNREKLQEWLDRQTDPNGLAA